MDGSSLLIAERLPIRWRLANQTKSMGNDHIFIAKIEFDDDVENLSTRKYHAVLHIACMSARSVPYRSALRISRFRTD